MIDDVPIISVNLRFYNLWAFENNWRRWSVLGLGSFLNLTQILDLFVERAPIGIKIRNAFIVVLWFNAVVRSWIFFLKKTEFVSFMENIEMNYILIKNSKDPGMIKLLQETIDRSRKWNYGNLVLGFITCIAFDAAPCVADTKELPYGFYFPGIDKSATPYYEVIFFVMVVLTPLGCYVYIPMSNLFVNYMMFGTLMSKILQYKLRTLNLKGDTETMLMKELVWCVYYQRNLIRYVNDFNLLISTLFLIEFALYGTILCALLFLVATISDFANLLITMVYVTTVFSQISAFAWYANELYDESFNVAIATYETKWIGYSYRVKMTIAMILMRSQKPLAIKMGGIYDMNLQSFQSLLNATYTFFTLLKRVYRQR